MRRTLLAFFGLSFVVYWMSTADLRPNDPREQLDPVVPALVRMGAREPGRVDQFVRKQFGGRGGNELHSWLKAESERIGRVDPEPSVTAKNVKERALLLRPTELSWLKKTAMGSQASVDERFLAVYMIGLSEAPQTLDLLKEIAVSRIVAPANDRRYSDEFMIRAQALDSLVQRAPRTEAIRYLRELLAKTSDAGIARHAQHRLSQLH